MVNFAHPGLIYLLLASILLSAYFGIEQDNGGLKFTSKSVICLWSSLSLLIVSAIYSMKATADLGFPGFPTIKDMAILYTVAAVTLSISSSCVYSAY